MKKRKQPKKLQLNKESVATLDNDAMEAAKGGFWTFTFGISCLACTTKK